MTTTNEPADCYGKGDACLRPGCPCCDPNVPEDAVRAWMLWHGVPGAIHWKRARPVPGKEP